MTYRERREARARRLAEWAAKREAKAAAMRETDEHLRHDWTFITQPGRIPARERMNARDERAYKIARKGQEMAERAENITRQLERAIYSDDPDAIEALTARVATLEAKRDAMKAANKTYRAAHKEELRAMTPFQRAQAVPAPSYALTNLSADIRRNTKRLEALKREATDGDDTDG